MSLIYVPLAILVTAWIASAAGHPRSLQRLLNGHDRDHADRELADDRTEVPGD